MRKLTDKQQLILSACHHFGAGLTQAEAAHDLGITRQAVNSTLRIIKQKHPEVFPILTKEQYAIQQDITQRGLTHQEIANKHGLSVHTVDNIVSTLRHKGVYLERPKKTIAYKDYMDDKVLMRF